MEPIGYYLPSDDAICKDCYERSNWHGCVAIFSDEEADTPTHCVKCEALIPHALTSEGYEYVREAYVAAMEEHRGRRCIVKAWIEQYLRDTVAAVDVKDWPTSDEFTPVVV